MCVYVCGWLIPPSLSVPMIFRSSILSWGWGAAHVIPRTTQKEKCQKRVAKKFSYKIFPTSCWMRMKEGRKKLWVLQWSW